MSITASRACYQGVNRLHGSKGKIDKGAYHRTILSISFLDSVQTCKGYALDPVTLAGQAGKATCGFSGHKGI